MFTSFRSHRVFAFSALLALASGLLVAGCNLLDDSSAPTAPQTATLRAEQVGQCFATSEAPTEWAYSYTPGQAVFCVSVPEPGAYLLRYTVNGGTFEVVFEVSAAKRVYIGLLSNADALTAVSLQRGTLSDDAAPMEGDYGDIRFYAIPGSGVATGSVIADLSKPFALSNNGKSCLVIIPTPEPVPVTVTAAPCTPEAAVQACSDAEWDWNGSGDCSKKGNLSCPAGYGCWERYFDGSNTECGTIID